MRKSPVNGRRMGNKNKPSQEGVRGKREMKEGVPHEKVWWPPVLFILS